MTRSRASLHQRRLEAILEKYRDRDPRPGAEWDDLVRLWRDFIYPLRWRLALAIAFALLMAMRPYVWTYVTRYVVDTVLMVGQVIPAAEMAAHYRMVIYVFFINNGIWLLTILIGWQNSYQITYIGQRIVFDLRRVLHEKLTSLPLSFFDRTQTGRLLTVVLDDVGTVQQSITSTAISFFTNIASILMGGAIICMINWKIGVLVLIALPFYVMNYWYFRPRVREGNIAARRATTALYSRVEERVTAIRTVKVAGRERTEVKGFAESVNNLARLNLYLVRVGNWQNIGATVISATATGLVFYLMLRQLQAGHVTLGQVMQFYMSAGFLFSPAIVLTDLAMQVQRISVVMRRVFDLMEAMPEPEDRAEAVALDEARGDVAFDHVTFTYPGDERPTLREVSFQVPAGKQVAIMGPSGAGKSSLLYLLMRFYDPEAGGITLDGRDLRDVKLRKLRDRITLVMQEPVIFSGTVAENIRYGRLDAGDAEVRRAARDADLHEFVMSLPDSYDTVVGERGMALSGGQRQRLALAASLLSRPSVLLLDDTTSALDPETEARVQKTLDRLMRDRTCFVVTHRVSTAMNSDLVLMLEEGRLTQFGAPRDLLAEEGLFRTVYEQQLRESADAAAV